MTDDERSALVDRFMKEANSLGLLTKYEDAFELTDSGHRVAIFLAFLASYNASLTASNAVTRGDKKFFKRAAKITHQLARWHLEGWVAKCEGRI